MGDVLTDLLSCITFFNSGNKQDFGIIMLAIIAACTLIRFGIKVKRAIDQHEYEEAV